MLSRKVERLDSVKPWQPSGNGEGAKFYLQKAGKITESLLFEAAFSMDFNINEIEK